MGLSVNRPKFIRKADSSDQTKGTKRESGRNDGLGRKNSNPSPPAYLLCLVKVYKFVSKIDRLALNSWPPVAAAAPPRAHLPPPLQVKKRKKDVESKTQKKQKLSITSEAKVQVELARSNIKDKYKDATLLPKWKAFQTIIFLEKDEGLLDSSKIAAFDFDGCLVNTAVNRIGADAWSLMYRSVPDKLQKLHNDGYKLIIFTNESNIERWKNKRQKAVDSKIGRLNNFIKRVNVPIQVFIACGFNKSGIADAFRKPRPGMWHIMEQHFNSGIKIDMDQSFYVGDAAGRPSDHSDADIKFAEAVGLKFYVPEDYFDA